MKKSKRQWLVKVSGFDGFFAMFTGGDPTATSTKVWDGGALEPDILQGPVERSDVTVRRPYDYERDEPMLARADPLVGQDSRHTLQVWATDGQLRPLGRSRALQGTLSGVVHPETDARSTDAAECGLVFAIRSNTFLGG